MNTVNMVLDVAEKEVGYLEKATNSNLDSKTANAGKNNYTKYWRDLAAGMNGQPWCNAFLNWIFMIAYGVAAAKKLLCTDKDWSYYTPTSASYFKEKKQWYTSNPKVGDVIYFKNSTRIHHVGIVYKVDSTYVYTIEGNTSAGSEVIANGGGVAKKKYVLTNPSIAGYGRPKYDVESTPAPAKTTTTSSNKSTFQVKVVSNTLNVRKGPGTSYAVVTKINKNEVYNIVETKGDWGKLKSGAGWISIKDKYVKRV